MSIFYYHMLQDVQYQFQFTNDTYQMFSKTNRKEYFALLFFQF